MSTGCGVVRWGISVGVQVLAAYFMPEKESPKGCTPALRITVGITVGATHEPNLRTEFH